MGYILCEKHGGNGAMAVCSHISELVIANKRCERRNEVLFPVRYADGIWRSTTLLCAQCAEKHSVPPGGLDLHGDDELDKYVEEIGFTIVCPGCFKEIFFPLNSVDFLRPNFFP